jgi:basic membrane lipoprotein Med (substrate-binding protein (PBP1-ABC) superfamily)
MPNWTKRRALAAIGATALAAAGATTYFTLHTAPQAPAYPPARTRTTINFTACLVASTAGINASPQSQAVWQGLLNAQASTDIRIQSFGTATAETPLDAQTAVNTLALRGCDLITAATPTETAAVEHQAHLYPGTRFAVVTAPPAETPTATNLAVDPAGTDNQITAEITKLALTAVAQYQ